MEALKAQIAEVQLHCIRLIDELNANELPQYTVKVERFKKELSKMEGFIEGVFWQIKNKAEIETPED